MSKYVDAVKSARPEHLYVFDLDRTALDGGTVSDVGYNPSPAGIVEDTGFAEITVGPPLVGGVLHSNKVNVVHDYAVNSASDYDSHFTLTDGVIDDRYFEPANAIENWSIELVVRPGRAHRGRTKTDAHLLAFLQTGVQGLRMVYDFTDKSTPTVSFDYVVDLDTGTDHTLLSSGDYAADGIYHVVLSKTNDRYSLHVNGSLDGVGIVPTGSSLVALGSNVVVVGGWNPREHSDATIQSLAMFDRLVNTEEIKDRYQKVDFNSSYDSAVALFTPRVSIETELDASTGVLEPAHTSISSGVDSNELYENENNELMIQDSELAAGVTRYKKLKFDLTGLTEGVRTFLDVTTVTDANSSIVVEYSFDDAAWTTWTEGADSIPELDANWGGVV